MNYLKLSQIDAVYVAENTDTFVGLRRADLSIMRQIIICGVKNES